MPLQGKSHPTHRLAYSAMLLAMAMLLSYVESLLPLTFALPGMKLGLPNVAVMLAFFLLGPLAGAAVSFLRVLLSALQGLGNMTIRYVITGVIVASLLALYFAEGLREGVADAASSRFA